MKTEDNKDDSASPAAPPEVDQKEKRNVEFLGFNPWFFPTGSWKRTRGFQEHKKKEIKVIIIKTKQQMIGKIHIDSKDIFSCIRNEGS